MGTSLQPMDLMSPGRNLDAYISTVSAIPILSPEEERSLTERLYYQQDLEAARQLVMSHLRFVVHIAKSYSGYGLNQADLIQEGNVGLMKAIKRFDPRVGVRLVSFAVHWIKAEMHEFILKNWRIVKVATTKAQRKLFFNLRSSKKSLSWLTNDEVDAMATDLKVEPAVVREMERRMSASDAAFDLGVDDDNEEAYKAPAYYLEDKRNDPARLVEDAQWDQDTNARLASAIGDLDERSRNILVQRWLSEEKATLHELAAEYQVSAERIRQLEKNAMKKVRAVLEA
ncbi:RNA polymerase sigma factor RpoH [Motiliproteus coralliicola]|uniref:RNA polymerase sigma factor RpoH n=1 Tax=Motiliproteus coralliicola TaxID=2283196 RepID=A0A369WAE7_9GAMM|nr:RNA polymerase sigma factor RpoH [Motiliproteus coralliicola]RDE18990.1 RNA polymerase sigma factor RpoH [Motiliproteus coralliicola]